MNRNPRKKKKQPEATEPQALEPEVIPAEEPVDEESGRDQDHVIVVEHGEGAEEMALPVLEDSSDDSDEDDVRPSAPARYDPLSAYLAEISRHQTLDKSEEFELAKRYHEHKDLEAAYRLVVSNLWLVVKISRDYERAARNLLDVIQEGNIGLMEAVKNFDPYRGVRFPSYAVWWIKAYILRFIIANWRMVKIGTTQAQRKLFFNLKKERDKLEREGFFPAPKLLAEKLNVRESDVIEMEQRLGSPDVSVHAPLSYDSELDYLSTLPAHQPTAEDSLRRKEMQQLISESFKDFAAGLSERDRAIFEERLLGDEKVTLNDLAEKFGLSKERVRQLENRIREKLKTFMTERIGSDFAGELEAEDE